MTAAPVGNDVPCKEPPRVSIVNRQESLTPTVDCPGRLVSQYSDSLLALPRDQQNPDVVINPVKVAEAFYYLHTQDRSCWTHELQLTPFPAKPSF